ncbi:MAG: hypothetical protein PVH07_07605 [Chloroflexota bacterium]|jgi:hypothetical protein
MMRQRAAGALPLVLALLLALPVAAGAQVATLATPGPDAATTPPPAEDVEGEEAILAFVACLRDNGLDLPDPQFGPEGPRFSDPSVLLRIDIRSSEFLDAMEACQDLLAALQPEIDPEQQAEQAEQQLALAECMRREGIDFPDPDPVRGFTLGMMRDEDGSLAIDPFSPEFQRASGVCLSEMGMELGPAGPGSS